MRTPTKQAQEAEFGVNVSSPDLEEGPTNPLSLKRTFGSKEPIRVKLYRDHAAVSPAAGAADVAAAFQ